MTKMIDAISIARRNIYKGAGRLVIQSSKTKNFPTNIGDVMDPAGATKYTLASGWSDLGGTTEDGITINRDVELSDGIPVDQLMQNMDSGQPEVWTMRLECALVDTTVDKLYRLWVTDEKTTVVGDEIAQSSIPLDAPDEIEEKMLAVIQEDSNTERLRVFAFRKAKIDPSGSSLVAQKRNASTLQANFNLLINNNIDEGSGQFGMIFEET